MKLKTALLIKLKDFKKIDSWRDTSELIARKHAYNDAQRDLLHFIESFEAGNVSQDYLNTLKEQQES
jgi:hypothetical protein